LILYLSNLTMFVVANLARGQGMAALIGSLILAFLLWPMLPRALRLLTRWAGEGVGLR
ncbi:MAG: carotenoid biosynthesis protein, partial [Oscillochloris sp.]|nr:carotenoid biosynthesis protein [Oscillochloris sp.]